MNRSLASALTFALATACAAPSFAMGASDMGARGTAGSSQAPRQVGGSQVSAKSDVPKPPVLILALVGVGLAGLIVMQRKGAASN